MKLTNEQRRPVEINARGGSWSNWFYTPSLHTDWYSTTITTDPPNYEKQNTFYGVNPVAQRIGKRTTNESVCAVNCLYLDCDAKSGWDLAKVEALQPAASLIVDTGGGWHVYWFLPKPYPVNDDNRAEIQSIVKRWVKHQKGDPGAADLARVLRVPGTLNYKYDPPRPVTILQPDNGLRYELADLAAMIPPPEEAPQEERAQLPPGDTDTSARNLVTAALEKWIVEEGGRNKAGYKLACQLRDLGISRMDAERYMEDYQWRTPKKEHQYTNQEALESLESAYKGTPRQPPQGKNPPKAPRAKDKTPTVKTPPTPDILPQSDIEIDIHSPAQLAENLKEPEFDQLPGTTEAPQGARPARKTSWTMAEIMGTTFQEPIWTVPERIPEGLVDLCGRPKAGKSWMALNIALAKTTGGKFLGRSVKPGKVLYLALEDNPRRIQKRLEAMGATKPGPLQFEFTWKPLHQGGLNDLLIAIEAQSYGLIVIDTLARAIPGVNHNDENPVGPIMDSLQSMAINHGITILLVDHTRKANGLFADPIDDVMGSTAKSRTLDAVLAIYKTKGKPGATLQGRGRDIEEFEEAVTFDITTGAWQSLGDAGQLAITRQRQDIIDAVKALGKAPFAAIQKNSGIEKANLSRQLTALAAAGDLNTELIEGRVFYYAK